MNHKLATLLLSVIFAAVNLSSQQGRVNVVEITTKQVFDIVVLRNNQRPVIVYFTKDSCGRCTEIRYELEERARSNTKAMDLAIVDLDVHPELKAPLGITVIPTTKAYYKGAFKGIIKGPSPSAINVLIDKQLNNKN